jgi:alanine racemase
VSVRVRLTLDRSALLTNVRVLRQFSTAPVLRAVVKCDAYGHGAVTIARWLEPDVEEFAVASVDEGVELRLAGIIRPVYILSDFDSQLDVSELVTHNLSPVIHSSKQLHLVKDVVNQLPSIVIKMDTGMGRLGFLPEECGAVYELLNRTSVLGNVQIMSHFSCANDLESCFTEKQYQKFLLATDEHDCLKSIANSAALLAWPKTHLDCVRPGLSLYGISPIPDKAGYEYGLQPVMGLTTRILTLKNIPAGHTVGYGAGWVASRDTTLAVLPCGYGDGYPRHAPGSNVFVNGELVPVVGQISMDSMTVDVTGKEFLRVDNEVELVGPNVCIESIENASGVSSYEILCNLGKRITRDVYGYT